MSTQLQVVACDLLTLMNQAYCLSPGLEAIRRHLLERSRLVPGGTFLVGANGMVELPEAHMLFQLTRGELRWLIQDLANAYKLVPLEKAVPYFLTGDEYSYLVTLFEREMNNGRI